MSRSRVSDRPSAAPSRCSTCHWWHRQESSLVPNRLANSTSPYLQQHANNPVEWWEWGPEAFEEARVSDRPILLSIGYAACHWCHVTADTDRSSV